MCAVRTRAASIIGCVNGDKSMTLDPTGLGSHVRDKGSAMLVWNADILET